MSLFRGRASRLVDPELYRRAGALFDQVAELDETEREAVLERASRVDSEAVALARRLLEADRAPQPLPLRSDDASTVDLRDPAGVLGASIGPYRIERLLGCGGMGAVYLGRRDEPAAKVAVKYITLSSAAPPIRERFRLETQWLASLDHPGIVRYRSSSVDTHNRPYLIMDFIDGQPISSSTPEVKDSVDRTVELVLKVAEAVSYLHQRGILHGDLKPSNILLARRGSELAPVIIDLGIARALGSRGPDGDGAIEELTGRVPAGTPRYMSPELSQGPRGPDVRSDVYALGAVLFGLLTGQSPPVASEPKVLETFGASRAKQRARQIDLDLGAITLKALATDPERRYGSAEAFIDDLRCWRRAKPVDARDGSVFHRLRLLGRRRPLESTFSVLLVLVLSVASVVVVRSLVRERAQRIRYEEQVLVNEKTIEFFSDDLFRRALPENDGPHASVVTVLRGASQSFSQNQSRYSSPVIVSVGASLLWIFNALDLLPDLQRLMEDTAPHAEKLPPTAPARLRFDVSRGGALFKLERYAEAEALLLDVWGRLRDHVGEGGAGAANSHHLLVLTEKGLGMLYEVLGKLDEAERWLNVALEDSERYAVHRNIRLETRYALAVVQMARGQHDAAIEGYQALREEFAAQDGPRSRSLLGVETNLATLYMRTARPELAMVHAEAACEIADAILDPGHENRLIALSVLGTCMNAVEDYEGAVDIGYDVVDLCRVRYGEDSSELASQILNLVENLLLAERGEEGLDLALEALAIYEGAGEGEQENLARAAVYVAQAALDAGQLELAQSHGSRALSLLAAMDGVEGLAGLAGLEELVAQAKKTHEAVQAALAQE